MMLQQNKVLLYWPQLSPAASAATEAFIVEQYPHRTRRPRRRHRRRRGRLFQSESWRHRRWRRRWRRRLGQDHGRRDGRVRTGEHLQDEDRRDADDDDGKRIVSVVDDEKTVKIMTGGRWKRRQLFNDASSTIVFLTGHSRSLFLYFCLLNTVESKQMFYIKACR